MKETNTTYPYIGKCIVNNFGDFSIALLIGSGKGALLKRTSEEFELHDFDDDYDNDSFTNITREYLEGKCVKIESPEHSEFVQKLAFNAGFEWKYNKNKISNTTARMLTFHADGDITFDNNGCNHYEYVQITIPLPPKAESEPKEWPQVGDKISINGSKPNPLTSDQLCFTDIALEVISKVNRRGGVILTLANDSLGVIAISKGEWIEKPKTKAEILRDELIDLAFNQFNDDSHPLDRNAYYLISELMDKFNITKKPQ